MKFAKLLLAIGVFIIFKSSYSQFITSDLQELKGSGSIRFIFERFDDVYNGISLGSTTNAYTEFRISYADTATGETSPSLGWQLTLSANNEFEADYGMTPPEANDVDLADITVYVSIGEAAPTVWNSYTPSVADVVIASGNEKFIQDTMIFIYYTCSPLDGRIPNYYNSLFNFNLGPQ